MKQIIAILLFILSGTLIVSSQELKVTGFRAVPMDLSASTHMRRDANGTPCALVKVQLRATGASFEGNIVGDTQFRTNEYWVYLTEGTKMLRIKHISAQPLMVRFADHGTESLLAKNTYELSVALPTVPTQTMQQVVINFTPESAMVIIDGKVIKSTGGTATTTLPADNEYSYIVAAEGYDTSEGAFRLKATSPTRLNIQLYKESASTQQLTGTGNLPATNNTSTTTATNAPTIYAQANKEYNAKNYAKAMQLYKQIPDDKNAQFQIGYMYDNGLGTTQSDTDAAYWYRKAAEQGYASAQYNLGIMYKNGQGVTQSYTDAVYWYRKAAEQGYASAQCNLGYMYENGRGVTQSYADAVYWYRKAAEQGDATAQSNLGIMYENGQGVTQSYTDAVYWYRKAAEQGYAKAQSNLGDMYFYGRGVTQSYTDAVYWYQKAAEQGHALGQANLGYCYYYGKGVEINKQEAYRLIKLAADQGNEWSKKFLAEHTF
nr:SEL1-like repeat protein [uncultured Muribaculum sp.]